MQRARVWLPLALIGLGFAAFIAGASAQPPPNVLLKLEGHAGAVNCAEFLLDGTVIATAGADQSVRLWNAATGQEIRRFEGHQGQVLSLAPSPDGLQIASGAQDNQIRLWDVPQSKPIRTLTGHDGGAATRFAVSQDGQVIASVGADKTVRLWLTSTGESSGDRTEKTTGLSAVAYRFDNQEFADGGEDGRIHLWIPFDEKPQGSLGAHTGAVRGLHYHPNNQQLFSAGADGTAKLWQLPIVPPRSVTGHTAAVTSLVIAPNNQHLLTGCVDKTPRLFDLQNRQLIRAFPAMAMPVTSVAASANSALVAAADEGGQIQLWNYADGNPQPLLRGHAGAVRSIAFHPDSQRLASAGDDGTVRLWTIPPLSPQSLGGHQGPVRAVAGSPDGRQIATVAADKTVHFWNPNGQAARQYAGHQAEVLSAAYRGDGGLIATGDAAGKIHVQSNDGSLQGIVGAHAGSVTAVAFHPTQQLLYTAGDGVIKQWLLPLSQPRPLGGHPEAVRAVAVTADGRFALSSSQDNPVRVWDTATGNHVRNLDGLQGPINGLAVSPDGNTVAGVSESGGIKFWNLGDGADKGTLIGHGGPATAVEFHPNGLSIAVACADGIVRIVAAPPLTNELAVEKSPAQTAVISRDGKVLAMGGTKDGKPAVLLRDPANGNLLGTLLGHESAITALGLNADHTKLVSGSADNTIRVWNLAAANFPEIAVLNGHQAAPVAVAISDDGTLAWSSVAGENHVHQWTVAEGKVAKQLSGHGGAIAVLKVHGETLASGSADGTVRTWKIATGEPAATISHGAPVADIAFSPDGATVASGGADKIVKLWTTASGAAIKSLDPLEGGVAGVAFSPDGSRISGCDGSQTRTWLANGTPLDRSRVGNVVARGVGFLADSRSLVTPIPDGAVKVASATVLQTLAGHEGAATSLSFAANGESLVTGGADKSVRAWTLASGQQSAVFVGPADQITGVAVSPEGEVFASSIDKKIYTWKPAGPAAPDRVFEQTASVRAMKLSRDGKRLISGGDDRLVVVRDAVSGLELERFSDQAASVRCVAISNEGRTLVSGGDDKQARLQTVSAQRILSAAGAPAPPIPAAGAIQDLAVLPGSFRIVASISGERQLRVWQPDGQPAAALATAGPVARFAVAPDGRQLVAVGTEGHIQFWSIPDLQPIRTIETKAPLTTLVFNPDGSRLAIGDGLSQVRVYSTSGDCRMLEQFSAPAAVVDLAFAGDAQKPAILVGSVTPTPTLHLLALQRVLEAHPGGATTLAFSSSGDQLLTGGADGKVVAWKTNEGEKLRTYEGATAGVACVSFSRDNAHVFAGGLDNTVRQWTAADAALKRSFSHPAPIRSLSPSHDNQRIATSGDDQLVHVWDLASGRKLQFFEGHAGPALGVAFASDNRTIVSGGSDQSVRLWNLAATRVVDAHAAAIVDLFQTNGGGAVVTLGLDGKARQWDANLNPGRTFDGWAGEARSLAVRFDSQQIAIGLADQILILNFGDGSTIRKIPTRAAVTTLAFSQDNQKLACTTEDKRLLVFGTQDWAPLQETPMSAVATDLAFSADHRRMWTTDDAGKVSEWVSTTPKETRIFQGHGGAVYGLAFTGDGKTIISSSADQTLRSWDVAGGNQRQQFGGHQGPVYGLARSPDSALLVSTSGDKSIRLWNLVAGNQLTQLPSGDQTAYSVAFHPDGRTIAAAGADKKIRIFDILNGTLQKTLEGHPDYIHRVSYNPTGTRLLSCGYSGRLFFWNPDGTLALQHRLSDVINAATYSADGSRIAIGGSSGHAYVIETPAAVR